MRSRLLLRGARRRRPAASAVLVAIAALAPVNALAHGGDERPLATLPASPPGDGAKAEQLLRELADLTAKPKEASAQTPKGELGTRGGPASPDAGGPLAKVVAEPVARAKQALGRAHGARAAGDAAHARLLDALALEWAETARALLRAAASEAAATEAARRARAVGTQLERARALLEETQARRGRAAAELERLEAEARDNAKSAAGAEQDRIEASKRGGKAVKPDGARPSQAPRPDDAAARKPQAPKPTTSSSPPAGGAP